MSNRHRRVQRRIKARAEARRRQREQAATDHIQVMLDSRGEK